MVDDNEVPAVEQTVTPSADDEFSAAFAQFASPGEKPAETAPSPDAEVQEAPPADAEAGDEAAPEEVTADSGNQEPEPAPAPEPPRLTAEEWMRIMAAQQQQQAQYGQQSQPAPQAEQPVSKPVLSKEEVETLQEFQKDWPDVAKALEVQQKAFANDLLNYVFGQIAQEVAPKLALVDELTERTHVTDIYDFVPDYDQVREPVINWVSQLPPSAFRNYAVGVVQQGAPNDIQALVDQWRTVSGQQAPAPMQRAPAPVAPQRKAADPALKRAAAALAPVKSQRTTVVQTDDPNDFDGAFERYAQQMRSQRANFTGRQ